MILSGTRPLFPITAGVGLGAVALRPGCAKAGAATANSRQRETMLLIIDRIMRRIDD